MSENFDDFGVPMSTPDYDNIPKYISGEDKVSFYQHEPGTYRGFVGRLIPKFKNAQGEKIEGKEPGAVYSHSVLQLWITGYTKPGSNQMVNKINNFQIPEDKDLREFYYPQLITSVPSMMWVNKLLFKNWKIPNIENSAIIQFPEGSPLKFHVNLHAFRIYIGLPIQFNLVEKKSGKDGVYIKDEIKIVSFKPLADTETINKFFEYVDERFRKEQEKRKNEQEAEGRYVPTKPPSIEDILNDDIGKFIG